MNQTLQNFARQFIRDGMKNVPERNKRVFRLMYRGKIGMDKIESVPINELIENMPEHQLDWAMEQVIQTHKSLAEGNQQERKSP